MVWWVILLEYESVLENSMNERHWHIILAAMPQISQTVNLTNDIDVDQYNRSLVQQMRRG